MVKTEEIIKKINTESLKTVHMTICECLFSPNKMMPKISHVHGLDYCFSYKTHSAYRLIHLSLFFFFFFENWISDIALFWYLSCLSFSHLFLFLFSFYKSFKWNERQFETKHYVSIAQLLFPTSNFEMLSLASRLFMFLCLLHFFFWFVYLSTCLYLSIWLSFIFFVLCYKYFVRFLKCFFCLHNTSSPISTAFCFSLTDTTQYR